MIHKYIWPRQTIVWDVDDNLYSRKTLIFSGHLWVYVLNK